MAISRFPMLGQADDLITVVILILGGLWWLFRKLAESQGDRRQPQPPQGGQEATFAANEEEVQRFLESLGQTPAAPKPPPHPQPSPPTAGRAPGRPQPTATAAPPRHPTPHRVLEVSTEPTLRPDTAYEFNEAKTAEPLAQLPTLPDAPPTPARKRAARTVSRAVHRLEFPHLSPLQRAVVLREVLERKRGPHNPVMHG